MRILCAYTSKQPVIYETGLFAGGLTFNGGKIRVTEFVITETTDESRFTYSTR